MTACPIAQAYEVSKKLDAWIMRYNVECKF